MFLFIREIKVLKFKAQVYIEIALYIKQTKQFGYEIIIATCVCIKNLFSKTKVFKHVKHFRT